jgi:hypothetical protein
MCLAFGHYRELYRDAAARTLCPEPTPQRSRVSCDATSGEQVSFDHRFGARAELTGQMRLKLWVSTDHGDDLDLFVAIKKLDADGGEVCFEGRENHAGGPVSKGWQRVSHRALDAARSRPCQPVLSHTDGQYDSGLLVPFIARS